ncbi:MAG TPA: glycosyltransferase family 4 protein [Xylella sp.]
MKLVIDMLGGQTRSHLRGIGRYTRELTKALLRQASEVHDIHLVLHAPLEQATDAFIAEFGAVLPRARIHLLRLPRRTSEHLDGNIWRRYAASRLSRYGLTCLDADVVWHSSVFEGYDEDAVLPDASLPLTHRVATLYDLIPLHDPEAFLQGPLSKAWYARRSAFLSTCDRLFCLSEWTAQEAVRRLHLDPGRLVVIGGGVDSSFRPLVFDAEQRGRLLGRFSITRPYVLYNGGLDERKNVPVLLRAFARLPITLRQRHQLVVLGDDREVRRPMAALCRELGLHPQEVVFTGRVSDADLVALYGQCALFVFPSRLEGFGLPVLEAMACGAPTLCSDAASLPEVAGRKDMLFPPDDHVALSARMCEVLDDPGWLQSMRDYGVRRAAAFTWDGVAQHALEGLARLPERSSGRPARCVVNVCLPAQPDTGGTGMLPVVERQLVADLAALPGDPERDDLAQAAFSMCSMRVAPQPPQWLVDVSSIAQNDIGTGTFRVARSILCEWLSTPPPGACIVPVCLRDGQYHYARHFAAQLLGVVSDLPQEGIVMVYPGDVFVGLDWAPEAINAARARLQEWRRVGVATCFVVHDLLPITLPGCFHPYSRTLFEEWLRTVVHLADGIACVSATTAGELSKWLEYAMVDYQFGVPPKLMHFPLGVSFPERSTWQTVIRQELHAALAMRPTLLIVGTLEPRKGHGHALRICEQLWQDGEDVNLVVVGQRGWSEKALVMRLTRHREAGRRLFWLSDASDAELSALYTRATVLLALSEGEGYGLPLLEAAYFGLPILARPLPVFREIMADYPHYLDDASPDTWPAAVAQWLHAPYKASSGLGRMISWRDSAQILAGVVGACCFFPASDRLTVTVR